MILKDVAGRVIFPSQILGLAVVPVGKTPARDADTRPDVATHALVVDVFDPYVCPDTNALYKSPRYAVLAWFDDEAIANERLNALLRGYQFSDTHYRMFFTGEVRVVAR